MFDIRNYKAKNIAENAYSNAVNERYAFIKYMDEHFDMINQECDFLVNNKNNFPNAAEAFEKKVDAWKGLVDNLQILCEMYKIKDAQCLS